MKKFKEKVFGRILEIIPGFLLWLLFTSPFWMSIHLTRLIGNLIITMAVYWFYKAIIFQIGLVIGYLVYKKELKINWLEKCNKLDLDLLEGFDKNQKDILPNHLIVFPIASANYDVISKSLQAIVDQNYPIKKIFVSLSFEKRFIDKDPENFQKTRTLIEKNFLILGDRLMFFIHPDNIEGEAIGAAANRTWGTQNAVKELEKNGFDISKFLTTSPDEDLRFHTEYLARVSYEYLISEKRDRKFYQTSTYLFYNNYWQVPGIIRTWAISLTLPVLSSSYTNLRDRETWSCYSINLALMKEVNYWDTSIGIDDTPFFWRPFDRLNGDFECATFAIPLYADAVYHPNKIKNLQAQYKQLVRWGWGIVTFPIAMQVLKNNKKIPLRIKLKKIFLFFENYVLFRVSSILFTFAFPIISIINPNFSYSALSYTFPTTLSLIMRMSAFLLIPVFIFKILLLPPNPKWSIQKHIVQFILEIPLHVVLWFTYALIPFIVGPTKMMLGHKYEFVVTEKKV